MFTILNIIWWGGIIPMYILEILFAAVMNFKNARDLRRLSKIGMILGYPPYIIGILLDIYCNIIPISILLLEFPKIIKGEFTVTSRMTRLSKTGGWRGDIARWFCEDLLNGLDPSGNHCK